MDNICIQCGSIGGAKTYTPGSFIVECFLWCFFIFPGVLYSLWRLSGRRKACWLCGAGDIVPVDSPVGKKLIAQADQNNNMPPARPVANSGEVGGGGPADNNDVSIFRIPV